MFDYLNKYEVTEESTREFPLVGIVGVDGNTPVLIVRTAAQANKTMFNAVLKRRDKRARDVVSKIDADFFEVSREDDRSIYAEFVLVNWRDLPDNDGKAVPYSRGAAKELMAKLPSHKFDRLRIFCQDTENFMARDEGISEDVAGN